jgi:hypothetical protein
MRHKLGDLWFPIWIDKLLFGSTRIELAPDERSVWIDLLALSYKDEGYIRANKNCPYPVKQLAGMLLISEELLIRTLNKCLEYQKIKQLTDGTYYVNSYKTYRLSNRHSRRFNKASDLSDNKLPVSVKCPPEFKSMTQKNGMVRSSRLLIAQQIGRPLKPEEQVHHIDGDITNNKLENLMLFATQKDHDAFEWNKNSRPIWCMSQRKDMASLKEDAASSAEATRTDYIRSENNIRKERTTRKKSPPQKMSFNFSTKEWEGITEERKEPWKKAYPACDISLELSKMAAWLIENPDKKKIRYGRFIINWLSRSQDRGGTRGVAPVKDDWAERKEREEAEKAKSEDEEIPF